MALFATETPASQTWEARPNQSLSSSGGRLLLIAATCISGGIAITFCFFGAWPVVPFAGLEIAALLWAMQRNREKAGDFERITIETGRLTIDSKNGLHREHHEFNPCWAKLQCSASDSLKTMVLQIRSHGETVAIGNLLTEEQKSLLANAIKQALRAR